MARVVQYRTGMNERTGQILKGFDHVLQSLRIIWTTRTNTLPMLLGFGSDVRGNLGQDITPSLALEIYDDMVTAAHKWEPEYRVTDMQFVKVSETGLLALKHSGIYFPEGRFENYDIVELRRADPLNLASLTALGTT